MEKHGCKTEMQGHVERRQKQTNNKLIDLKETIRSDTNGKQENIMNIALSRVGKLFPSDEMVTLKTTHNLQYCHPVTTHSRYSELLFSDRGGNLRLFDVHAFF